MINESDFYIKNPKQILHNLKRLMRGNCFLSAHFGDDNKESFITTLLDVDGDKKLVYLDYGPSEYLNKNLLTADQFEFRTELDGIKVIFTGLKIVRSKFKGQPVFALTMPDSLFWMERRKAYRVKVPQYHESVIRIPLPVTTEQGEEESRIFTFTLLDLSISGAAFLNEDPKISRQFTPTSELPGCQLNLHGSVMENITVSIKNKRLIDNKKPEKGQRLGCHFENLNVGMESRLQRYLQDIEREMSNIRSK